MLGPTAAVVFFVQQERCPRPFDIATNPRGWLASLGRVGSASCKRTSLPYREAAMQGDTGRQLARPRRSYSNTSILRHVLFRRAGGVRVSSTSRRHHQKSLLNRAGLQWEIRIRSGKPDVLLHSPSRMDCIAGDFSRWRRDKGVLSQSHNCLDPRCSYNSSSSHNSASSWPGQASACRFASRSLRAYAGQAEVGFTRDRVQRFVHPPRKNDVDIKEMTEFRRRRRRDSEHI